MFSRKSILKLTWPIIVEQALNSLVFIVSTILVSGVGGFAVSAVGLVDSFNNVVMQFFASVATGTTVVVSQLSGRGDHRGVYRTISQSVFLAFCVAALLGLSLVLFAPQIFGALFSKTEQNVLQAGLIYMTASGISYPFLAVYSTVAGIMRGEGNSNTPMLVSVVVNVVNVGIGAALILGADLGILGAAVAMVSARFSGAALSCFFLMREKGNVLFVREAFRFKAEILKPVLHYGIPAAIDSLVFNGGKLLTQSFLSGVGTAQLSANAIASSIFNFVSIPGNAINIAVVTVTGQCWGAGRVDETRRNLRSMVLLGMATLTLTSAVFAVLLPLLMPLYRPEPGVTEFVYSYMYFSFVTQAVLWSASFILPSGLRATGDVKYVTAVSVASMWFVRVAFSLLLGLYFNLGMLGVWIAMSADWGVRAVFYLHRAVRGTWFKKHAPPPHSDAEEADCGCRI